MNNPLRYTDPTGNEPAQASSYDFGEGWSFDWGGGGSVSGGGQGRFDLSFNFSTVNTSNPSYSANNYNRPASQYSDLSTSRIFGDFGDFGFEAGNLPIVGSSGQGNPSSFTLSVFVDAVSILLPPVGLARSIAEAVNWTDVSDKAPLTPFEIGLGLATVGKGRATTKFFSAVEGEAQLLLKGPRQMMDHHLLPKQFQSFFEQRGIDIDSFTVSLGEITHLKGIHGTGLGKYPGRWNKEWAQWIETNPSATTKDIYQQVGRMMDRFNINDLPIHQYGK